MMTDWGSRKEMVITTEDMKEVFEGTNFGNETHERMLKYSLLKIASGYRTGHTMECIMKELGLITKIGKVLTKKGKYHLWLYFSEGYKRR